MQKALIPTILVTSASKKVPLVKAMQVAAKRIHPNARVIVGDSNSQAISAFVASEFWVMPSTVDASLSEIINGCKKRGVTVVLPTRDGELSFWSIHKQQFYDEGIEVIVSPLSSLQLCLDKYAFSKFCKMHNQHVIPSGLSADELPCDLYVVKERYGAGSRNLGLALDIFEAKTFSRNLSEPIFQPYILGTEISIDAWLDRYYKIKGMVLRHRELVVNGESQITSTFRDSRIECEVRCLLELLKLSGPVIVQAIIDQMGSFHFIECNPRFGGASTASIAAGLDSLYWSLLESQGIDVSNYPFSRIAGEVRQIRIPEDMCFYDINF